ncbi:MAG: 2-oxo acid dehydrogenase subunit E2 [Microvirga sp.]
MATEVKIPDIGDYKDVPIVEVHVKEGDPVNADDPLISLESDKATMEVPAPSAGIVEKLLIKLGDKVSEGHPIVLLKDGDATMPEPPSLIEQQEPTPPPDRAPSPPATAPAKPNGPGVQSDFGQVHASPSVRRLARELEIDLGTIRGTGEKGRITKDDVKAALRGPAAPVSAPAPAGGMGIPEIPAVDFSKFGPIETRPLPRIKKISGPHLHRAWLNVPLVTHQDEADITETDVYRKELDAAAKDKGYRVTLLAFLMKAAVSALKEFPEFNASLSPEKDALILKQYYHIGVAVDTPEGLVVPVIRDVDRKGIVELSGELAKVSEKARAGKLTLDEMSGGVITISNLGGIGGVGFSPIVNWPEVAILGISRGSQEPVWDGHAFQPRLMLPLSLSYDHRVIDGADAARFLRWVCDAFENPFVLAL